MRYIYILLILIVTVVFLLFAFQNLESVNVSFFSASLTLPLSGLVLLAYLVGVLTGGFAISLLRTLVHGATSRPGQD